MSCFSKNIQQPLIKNNKNFQVHEHVISIQSEDRDTLKWPNSNQFEFELPIEYKNICALRILDIQIPTTFYNFSNRRQNTKLLLQYNGTTYTITIDEGTYTPDELATELTVKINAAGITGLEVIVKHNTITKKMYFFSNDSFILDFAVDPYCNVDTIDVTNCPICPIPPTHFARSNRPRQYLNNTLYANNSNCNPTPCNDPTGENRYNQVYSDAYVINHGPTAFDKYSEWGLGDYIGFNKETYQSETAVATDFAWINSGDLFGILPSGATPSHVIISPRVFKICDFDNMYMELDKFNCIDELEPYSYNTNAANQVKYANYKGKKIPVCCNEQQPNKTYNGKHNSAIAIIRIGGSYIPGDSMISGTFDSLPPVPRIKKFKVKFRWHDGELVDFNNCNINFVIQAMELINDMHQPPNITNINSVVF